MRIVICDDSQDDRQTLMDAIRALRADDDVFEQYASAEELLQQVSSLRSCDALFLDIFMHQSTGMDAAHQLRRLHVDIPIVFLTSSPDFALDGFDVDALDYLMKPVDRKRLEKVLLRIVRRRSTGPSYIYRKNSEIRCIPYRDIVFVESRDHRVFLHLAGETIDILTKIDDIVPEVVHGGTILTVMQALFPEEQKPSYVWQPAPGGGYVVDLAAHTYRKIGIEKT